jgi:hypothetical protein
MRSAGGANCTPRVCSKHTLNSFPPSWETLETLGLAANLSRSHSLATGPCRRRGSGPAQLRTAASVQSVRDDRRDITSSVVGER